MSRGKSPALLIGTAWLLAGCTSLQPEQRISSAVAPPPLLSIDQGIRDRVPRSVAESYLTDGLDHLQRGDLNSAGVAFRKALTLQPRHVAANFLNAYVYHQRGQTEDTRHFRSAAVGYQLALEFDPQAWWAACFYGLMELERGDYPKARELLTLANSIEPKAPLPLAGLAISEYYLGNPDQAANLLALAQAVDPSNPSIQRNAIMVAAAMGDAKAATDRLTPYLTDRTDPLEVSLMRNRLQDWQRFHVSIDATKPSEAEPLPLSKSVPKSSSAGSDPGSAANDGKRQITIEAVIIRSTRTRVSQRGINLLDGLSLQFSGNDTRTRSTLTDTDDSISQAITRSIGVSEVSYALNIFNTTTDRNEIIARPTLLAMEDQTSSFFSGDVFLASITGQFDGETLTERVGVSVQVTPTFLSDEEFVLNIKLGDSDFSTETVAGTFQEALSISSTETNVFARLKLGQSLVLAGLNERSVLDKRDHVPVLGDIPVIQELFRSKRSETIMSEIMILLTPRAVSGFDPAELNDSQLLGRDDAFASPEARYSGTMRTTAQTAYARQFRKGDMQLPDWRDPATTVGLWEDVLISIYL